MLQLHIDTAFAMACLRYFPREDVPFYQTITVAFNIAAMNRFPGLQPILGSYEGGLEGIVDDTPVDTEVMTDDFGFWTGEGTADFPPNPAREKVFQWYGNLLDQLFMRPMELCGHDYGSGAVMRLDPGSLEDAAKVRELLLAAITLCAQSAEFGFTVMEELAHRQATGKTYGLRSWTNQDLARMFAPPPVEVR